MLVAEHHMDVLLHILSMLTLKSQTTIFLEPSCTPLLWLCITHIFLGKGMKQRPGLHNVLEACPTAPQDFDAGIAIVLTP